VGFLDTLVADAREALGNFTAPRVGALPDQPQPAFKDPHFFFGQPVTTGPYPLVLGVPQQINDPNVATAKASRYVQIQNATGCVLNVQTGVGNFTIQALAASTVPTDNQLPVTLNPISGYTNFSQYVQIVWLLDGQTSPMADGSINAPYVPGTPLSPVAQVTFPAFGGGTGPVQLLAAPSAGFAYQLYSIEFQWLSPNDAAFDGIVTVENTTTSTNLYSTSKFFTFGPPATVTTTGGGTILANGVISFSLSSVPQQAGAIAITWTNTESTQTVSNVTLNYFLVAIS
jgi:hypothetical protein